MEAYEKLFYFDKDGFQAGLQELGGGERAETFSLWMWHYAGRPTDQSWKDVYGIQVAHDKVGHNSSTQEINELLQFQGFWDESKL